MKLLRKTIGYQLLLTALFFVLAGFALGNFTTMLLHASMENPEHPPQVGVILDQKYDAFMIIMSLPF